MIEIVAQAMHQTPVIVQMAAKLTACPPGETMGARGYCGVPPPTSSEALSSIQGLTAMVGNALMGLGAVGAGAIIAFHALMRNMSGGDAQIDGNHLLAMRKAWIGVLLIGCVGAIAHFVIAHPV